MKAVKYTFDNHFAPAGSRAPIRRVEPKLDAKAVEGIREEAFNNGLAAGRDQAMAETARKLAEALESVSDQLQALNNEVAARRQAAQQETARLAHLIGGKLAATLVAERPLAEIEALVADCLATCPQEPKLVIKLDESLVGQMQEKVEEMRQRHHFEGQVIVVSDPGVAPGDGRVEWRDGGAERNSTDLGRAIAEIVERYVHSLEENGTGHQLAVAN